MPADMDVINHKSAPSQPTIRPAVRVRMSFWSHYHKNISLLHRRKMASVK